jgi:hypothetical protein
VLVDVFKIQELAVVVYKSPACSVLLRSGLLVVGLWLGVLAGLAVVMYCCLGGRALLWAGVLKDDRL